MRIDHPDGSIGCSTDNRVLMLFNERTMMQLWRRLYKINVIRDKVCGNHSKVSRGSKDDDR